MKRLVMGDTDKLMISSGGQWKRMSSSRQRGRSQRQDGGRRGLMEPPTVTTDAAACRKRPLTKIPAESMSEINESFRFSGQRRLVEVNATATRHADADGRPSVNGLCRRWPSVTDGSFIYVLVLVIAAAVLSAVIVTLGLRMRPVTQWHWPVARPVDGWMQPLPPRSRQFFSAERRRVLRLGPSRCGHSLSDSDTHLTIRSYPSFQAGRNGSTSIRLAASGVRVRVASHRILLAILHAATRVTGASSSIRPRHQVTT